MFSKDTQRTIFTLFVILDTNGKSQHSLGLVHIMYLSNPATLAANTALHETWLIFFCWKLLSCNIFETQHCVLDVLMTILKEPPNIIFKFSFKQEPYLHVIKEQKYRIALSQLRASSHTLEIERGRHDRPKKPVDARLCSSCSVIKDERHFICECSINWEIRAHMYRKVNGIYLDFALLSVEDKFVFFMTNTDHRIINWLGLYTSHFRLEIA